MPRLIAAPVEMVPDERRRAWTALPLLTTTLWALAGIAAVRLLIVAKGDPAVAIDVLRHASLASFARGVLLTALTIGGFLVLTQLWPWVLDDRRRLRVLGPVWVLGVVVGVFAFSRFVLPILALSLWLDVERHLDIRPKERRGSGLAVLGVAVILAASGSWLPTVLVSTPGDDHEVGQILHEADDGTLTLLARTSRYDEIQLVDREVIELQPDRHFGGDGCRSFLWWVSAPLLSIVESDRSPVGYRPSLQRPYDGLDVCDSN